jgi:inner membrane protein
LDLLTQGLLGGALALSVSPKSESRNAALVGFAAALLADADVLISASDDPLLNLELHRHFTHSLIFIPVGALIATLLLWPLMRKRIELKKIYGYALLGYGTSGLLDACTSYGTHLLWPFSETRVAWSIIAIVDPVFSLLLLISLIIGFKYYKPLAPGVGLTLAGSYLLLGLWQHQSALETAFDLAEQRNHDVQRIIVKPTLANLVLWRSVYQSNDRFYVDAIRVGLVSNRIYAGETIEKFKFERDLPQIDQASTLSNDVLRFSKLADGYVVPDPSRNKVLIDVRYSMLPNGVYPMWGIDLNTASVSEHAQFKVYRDRPENARDLFLAMLLGRDIPD